MTATYGILASDSCRKLAESATRPHLHPVREILQWIGWALVLCELAGCASLPPLEDAISQNQTAKALDRRYRYWFRRNWLGKSSSDLVTPFPFAIALPGPPAAPSRHTFAGVIPGDRFLGTRDHRAAPIAKKFQGLDKKKKN